MKKITLFALLLAASMMLLSACGYSSQDNESIGQIKKVANMTPILCGKRTDVDLSLGVMRNGVGSMSQQDLWLTVRNPQLVNTLKKAAETGAIVKVKYDEARVNFCWQDHELTSVEITQ